MFSKLRLQRLGRVLEETPLHAQSGGLATATAPLLLSRRPGCYWIPLSELPSLFLTLSPLNVSLIPSLWLSLLPLSDWSLVADRLVG